MHELSETNAILNGIRFRLTLLLIGLFGPGLLVAALIMLGLMMAGAGAK